MKESIEKVSSYQKGYVTNFQGYEEVVSFGIN